MADDISFEPASIAERRLAAMKEFRDAHKGEIITPRLLLAEVREGLWPDLHDHFDWDDASAGESHRLDQAKILLRLKTTLTISPTTTVRVPIMVSDPRRGGGGYLSTTEVVSNADLSRLTMTAELQQIRRALFRAQQISAATQFSSTIGLWLEQKLAEIDEEIGNLESGETAAVPPPVSRAAQRQHRR